MTVPVALAVVRNGASVVLEVGREKFAALSDTLDGQTHQWSGEVLQALSTPAQVTKPHQGLGGLAVPNQPSKTFRQPGQLVGTLSTRTALLKACRSIFDVFDPHRDMPPVQNVCDGPAGCRSDMAHQTW